MSDTRAYIETLFRKMGINTTTRNTLFDDFISEATNIKAVSQIIETQKMLTEKWKIKNRVADIKQQFISVPNGTVGKPYHKHLDFIAFGWSDIVLTEIENLEAIGLKYNNEKETIEGTPTESGDHKITLKFRIKGEPEDAPLNIKAIPLIINPNPKSLWKNLPSNDAEQYWKKDEEGAFGKLGEKYIAAYSKRGRSHANTGDFRDDDYAFAHFDEINWSVVAVADGAGSAKLSRMASKIVCHTIIEYFRNNLTSELSAEFDCALKDYQSTANEENQKKLSVFVYHNLSKAAKTAHDALIEFSKKSGADLRELYTTLVFCLIKKTELGYAILSFGVGDSPMVVINTDVTKITLMNWLDVGEFGGGTRFITMPEIFSSEKFATRFKFMLIEDFSYIFLMSDGIYDPKFSVEVNLEKPEKWQAFIADLKGDNEEQCAVDLTAGNDKIVQQLSVWMDFWSQGNHDDRTMCVIF